MKYCDCDCCTSKGTCCSKELLDNDKDFFNESQL